MERVRVTTHHTDGTSDTTYLGTPLRPADDGGDADAVAQFAAPSPTFWRDARSDVWRARLASPRVRAGLATGIAMIFGLVWLFWSGGAQGGSVAAGAGGAPQRSSGTPPTTPRTAGASSTTNPAAVTVHVTGAVVRPGVVRMPGAARVIDAIDAAGGVVTTADLNRINLAAPLTDGAQVIVPRIGEPGVGGVVPAAGATPSANGKGSAPVNLNTATVAELDALPGIGPSRALQIVREREQRGRFRSVDDLQRVSGLGAARIAALRDRVTI